MALYTDKEVKDLIAGYAIIAIGIGLALATFAAAPGMLALAFIKDIFGVTLDKGQMWTFAIILCAMILGWFKSLSDNWKDALIFYVLTCVAIITTLFVLSVGFKAKFPGRYLDFFF